VSGEQVVKKKPGRKSKEEEARTYLRTLGVDPDDIVPRDAASDPMPETDAEFFGEFKSLLWRRRHQLEGTAFTQALNALSRFAEANKQSDEAKAESPLVADVIAGIVALPVERRREILTDELVRLDAERARIVEVLDASGSADR
jgi:hypothetical protein